MKIVKTFATSANLGAGFDTLGICFDVYNEYSFEVSAHYIIEGFKEEFKNPVDNLIITSYEKVFALLNKELIYIKLTQIIQNIPESRGMGSSASCIVAGVLIANEILGNILTIDEVFNIASSIEGHPDNVAPLVYGGFTASFKRDKYITTKLNVASNFKFLLLIPPFKLSTSKARSVLPKEVKMSTATNNIACSITTVKAIENGDIDLLITANNDMLHEPYRLELIDKSNYIKEVALKNNASCYISGAGPTMIVISNEEISDKFDLKDWKKLLVKVNRQGAYVYEK